MAQVKSKCSKRRKISEEKEQRKKRQRKKFYSTRSESGASVITRAWRAHVVLLCTSPVKEKCMNIVGEDVAEMGVGGSGYRTGAIERGLGRKGT